MAGGSLARDHSPVHNSLPPLLQQPTCELQLLLPTELHRHLSFVLSLDKWGICNPSDVNRKLQHAAVTIPQVRAHSSSLASFTVQRTRKTYIHGLASITHRKKYLMARKRKGATNKTDNVRIT